MLNQKNTRRWRREDAPRRRHQPIFQNAQTNFLAAKTNWAHHQRDFSKNPFLYAGSKEPLDGKQAWRIHSARHCRRYKRLGLHHNKGSTEGMEGCNSSHTQQKATKASEVDCPWPKKTFFFLIGEFSFLKIYFIRCFSFIFLLSSPPLEYPTLFLLLLFYSCN